MGHNIRDYGKYKNVPIYRDYNIANGEQVYIGNGQGCSTFWFKNVQDARRFIDRHRDKIKLTNSGSVYGLIPNKLCRGCKGHYTYGSNEWKKAKENNCFQFKEELKVGK